jgi:hypothetical protein
MKRQPRSAPRYPRWSYDPGYYDRFPAELATVRTWIQTGAPNN